MNTKSTNTGKYKDLKIDPKIKLAVLWTALMFCYTYADILGFYAPGNLAELMAGEIAGIQMTQGLLLGSAVLMLVPTAMIALSVFLKAGINRWANILAGIIYLAVLVSTFFTGRNPAYYLLFAAVKAALLVWIVVLAWTWPRIEAGIKEIS